MLGGQTQNARIKIMIEKQRQEEHRKFQRQYQRDVTLAGIGIIVAVILIVGGVIWVLASIWTH